MNRRFLSISLSVWGYLLAILVGIALAKLSERWHAAESGVEDALLEPMQVKLGRISERDSWVRDYRVYLVPLSTVRSAKTYMLFLLIRASGTESPSTIRHSVFNLTGYDRFGTVKPIVVDTGGSDQPGPWIQLLDFLDRGSFNVKTNAEGLVIDSQ
jgi:hypothetical protein